jgi:hypothetical protein
MKQYWKNLRRTLSKPISILTVVWGTFYYILAGYIVLIRGDEFDTALLLGLALSVSLVVTLSLTNAIEER